MSEKETVLEIGVEGGGATIFRTLDGDGWRFHVEGTSMCLDENDDEAWRTWAKDSASTIQEALRSVGKDGSWVLYYPISVHPDYRQLVWEVVQETANKLHQQHRKTWAERSLDWEQLCLGESKGKQN